MRRFEHHVDKPQHDHPPATVQLVLDPGDEAAVVQWAWAQAGPTDRSSRLARGRGASRGCTNTSRRSWALVP